MSGEAVEPNPPLLDQVHEMMRRVREKMLSLTDIITIKFGGTCTDIYLQGDRRSRLHQAPTRRHLEQRDFTHKMPTASGGGQRLILVIEGDVGTSGVIIVAS